MRATRKLVSFPAATVWGLGTRLLESSLNPCVDQAGHHSTAVRLGQSGAGQEEETQERV